VNSEQYYLKIWGQFALAYPHSKFWGFTLLYHGDLTQNGIIEMMFWLSKRGEFLSFYCFI